MRLNNRPRKSSKPKCRSKMLVPHTQQMWPRVLRGLECLRLCCLRRACRSPPQSLLRLPHVRFRRACRSPPHVRLRLLQRLPRPRPRLRLCCLSRRLPRPRPRLRFCCLSQRLPRLPHVRFRRAARLILRPKASTQQKPLRPKTQPISQSIQLKTYESFQFMLTQPVKHQWLKTRPFRPSCL